MAGMLPPGRHAGTRLDGPVGEACGSACGDQAGNEACGGSCEGEACGGRCGGQAAGRPGEGGRVARPGRPGRSLVMLKGQVCPVRVKSLEPCFYLSVLTHLAVQMVWGRYGGGQCKWWGSQLAVQMVGGCNGGGAAVQLVGCRSMCTGRARAAHARMHLESTCCGVACTPFPPLCTRAQSPCSALPCCPCAVLFLSLL